MSEDDVDVGEADDDSPGLARARARRLTTSEVLVHGSTVAQWLATGLTVRRAVIRCTKPPPVGLGMKRVAARQFVGSVVRSMVKDAVDEPIESKRARIVEMTHRMIDLAANNTRITVQNGEAIEHPAPDTKGAIAALELLAKLEGVIK